jgi:serine/threonine protein kinase
MIRVQKPINSHGGHLVEDERNHWITCLNNAAQLQIEDLWDLDRNNSFGDGRYASVYPAKRKTRRVVNEDESYNDDKKEDTEECSPHYCALKIVDKNQFWRRVVKGKERPDTLVRELAVQSTMTASCGKISSFVRIHGVFETSDNLVIELELLEGKDLFDFISSKGVLDEREASHVMYDLLSSLETMGRLGLAHRDVKPANILMSNHGEDPVAVKLGDFGMSAFVNMDGFVHGRCGTPGYAAPEILLAGARSGYSGKCDIFSAGVTLYVMLSGYEPFYGEDEKELMEANKNAVVEYPASDWAKVSSEAMDLLRKMLDPDPNERISAKAALQHEWIRKYAAEKEIKRHSSGNSGGSSLGNSTSSRFEEPIGGACVVS